MSLTPIINQMLVLFLIMIIGYGICKGKLLGDEFWCQFSKLILNICVPATILASAMNLSGAVALREIWILLLLSTGLHGILLLLSLAVPRLLRVRQDQAGIYRYMTVFSNVTFMGFPVISAVFGADAIFYASIFNIPFHILSYSVGIYLIRNSAEKQSDKLPHLPFWRVLLHPAILASVAALPITLLRIPFPDFIVSTAGLLGQITTPGPMLIIGGALAAIPLRHAFTKWRLYPFIVFRLILFPLLLCLLLRPLLGNGLILGITIIMASMPFAANITMLCNEYGGDEKLASIGVFLSTLLSVVTIPALLFLLFT